MELITSAQNKRVRQVKALATKARLRRGEGKFVLEGDRLIADALDCGGAPALALYSPGRADYRLIARLQARDCDLLPVSEPILKHVSDTQQAPGIVAVFHIPKPPISRSSQRALILDAIREPGNMGTILRTAAAADAQLAILAPGCCDVYSPKALRAGMGAHFRLPIVEAGWREIAGFCSDLPVYAAQADGDCHYDAVDWRAGWALILGNEAHGLSQPAARLAQRRLSIPLARKSESLNVASAAAVMLFEAQRQRLRGGSTNARAPAVD